MNKAVAEKLSGRKKRKFFGKIFIHRKLKLHGRQKNALQKDAFYDPCDMCLGSLLDLCPNVYQSYGNDYELLDKAHNHRSKRTINYSVVC